MKKTNYIGVLAAPLLVFAMTLPSYADSTSAPTMCTDGTTTTSTGKGTCSGHGGVQKTSKTSSTPAPAAATPAAAAPAAGPAAAAKTPAASGSTDPTGATAKCKDGTYSKSKSHSGACSKHGGVDNFMDAK